MSYVIQGGLLGQGASGPEFPAELPTTGLLAAYLMQDASFDRYPQPSFTDLDCRASDTSAWTDDGTGAGSGSIFKSFDGTLGQYILNVDASDNNGNLNTGTVFNPNNARAQYAYQNGGMIAAGPVYAVSGYTRLVAESIPGATRSGVLAQGTGPGFATVNFAVTGSAGSTAWSLKRGYVEVDGSYIMLHSYHDFQVA
jgi:hypothetical protein